ncbi:MAG: hypothetical protein H6557_28815 [Lewinellaceae bacterium]|nr:hypothetical protein [Lewinellaceae bacterium]
MEQIRAKRFDEGSSMGTNFIYTVFLDSKGGTWFGTDGEYLSCIENGNIRNFAEADGIPLKAIYSITEDSRSISGSAPAETAFLNGTGSISATCRSRKGYGIYHHQPGTDDKGKS